MSSRRDGRSTKRGVVSVATCVAGGCQKDAHWRLFVGPHPTRIFVCRDHRYPNFPVDYGGRWVPITADGVPA